MKEVCRGFLRVKQFRAYIDIIKTVAWQHGNWSLGFGATALVLGPEAALTHLVTHLFEGIP